MFSKVKSILPVLLSMTFCYIFLSNGFFAWMGKLLNFFTPTVCDIYLEVIAYLAQAFGILIVVLYIKEHTSVNMSFCFIALSIVEFALIIVSSNADSSIVCIVSGIFMNILAGMLQALYFIILGKYISVNSQPVVFGISYSVSTLITAIISMFGTEAYTSLHMYLLTFSFLLISASSFVITVRNPEESTKADEEKPLQPPFDRKKILFLSLTVFVICFCQTIGFYYTSADYLTMPISHEVLRTAYSIGLILAGFIVSKSRKSGVICCMFCLAIPFFSIFFNEYAGAGISIWLINYLFTGFSSMYRACTYTYYARKRDSLLYLAPLGLIFGRLGEAGGSAIGIFSQDNSAFLIVVTLITFIISGVFLFIHYEQFYTSVPAIKTADVSSTEDILHAFRSKYNLTQREEDVLKLILDKKSNSQIAEELFVSENTVKFHVKNILSKTQTTKKASL